MLLADLAIIGLGFAVLSISVGEAIKRVVRIARSLDVSEYTISFILVGTLAVFPELAIGVMSAIGGHPTFGLGIVIGSNIIDMTLIIGLVAAISGGINKTPAIGRSFLFAVLLPIVLLIDGTISRLDGAILLGTYALFVRSMLPHRLAINHHLHHRRAHIGTDLSLLLLSLALLFAAGHFISESAGSLGESLGVPLVFLGSILAIGTCMPELALALRAAQHKHAALGLGNILGNVFADCLATIGIIALIAPITPQVHSYALISGTMMVLAAGLVLLLLRRKEITRIQGIALIMAYVVVLVLQNIIEHAM
ncbi:MAG TPA: hypothetical protein VJH22_01165 [Candidatus Nanoarchaeia archaeon]|nr:hypothetical protein [Candidatus Nanoarchaeia archaeon]